MIYFENQSDLSVGGLQIEEILQSLSDREVEVYIVDDEVMAGLNLEHRGKEGITDVLSFPCEAVVPNLPLGSIVMSASLIAEKAREYKHSIEDEIALLFIHGVLHLLGFDHERDCGEHREREEELIREFDLPLSLIVRNA
ncbi:rRNA maturation RNase YbeY [Helicobacter pametensis]|uniref:rRNA maturation RNase YbeY n=1 Tax=Helicobacter pametensis TaxID=95149 RepID=UPI0004854E23|nr:rRNA maturation RNase YbeY [Helicobacter pametensis]